VTTLPLDIRESDFRHCFRRWLHRLTKCSPSQGEPFEGERAVVSAQVSKCCLHMAIPGIKLSHYAKLKLFACRHRDRSQKNLKGMERIRYINRNYTPSHCSPHPFCAKLPALLSDEPATVPPYCLAATWTGFQLRSETPYDLWLGWGLINCRRENGAFRQGRRNIAQRPQSIFIPINNTSPATQLL
jgi:hypothetical protein